MHDNITYSSNPYVYPSDQFKLASCPVNTTISNPRTILESDIVPLLEKILPPTKMTATEANHEIAEKILAIFTDPGICFGEVENVEKDRNDWLKRIRVFTDQDIALSFTIHGFPFKMPVPVKTNRQLPDLGDYASLYALNQLMNAIGEIYAPGAKLTVICEDGFAPFMGVDPDVAGKYKEQLSHTSDNLGFQNLRFVSITDMEKQSDYQNIFKSRLDDISQKQLAGDEKYTQQYDKVFPIIFRIVNSSKYRGSEDYLVSLYNASESQSALTEIKSGTPEINTMYNDINARTHNAILAYFAYLETRDALAFVEKVAQKSMPLSVSPKRRRLGVFPIEPGQTKLPYHAVPVVENNRLTMSYLYDLLRDGKTYHPVYIKGDADPAPFYYETKG